MPIEDRFWAKVDKHGPVPAHRPELGPCWLWMGRRLTSGYGTIFDQGRPLYTHRFSYELHHGTLGPGVHVLHRCDNPPCCNPAHLRSGDQRSNTADRDAKGRVRHGERHASAKLTAVDVERIKTLYATGATSHRELARLFGLHHSTIGELLAGKTWVRG